MCITYFILFTFFFSLFQSPVFRFFFGSLGFSKLLKYTVNGVSMHAIQLLGVQVPELLTIGLCKTLRMLPARILS